MVMYKSILIQKYTKYNYTYVYVYFTVFLIILI